MRTNEFARKRRRGFECALGLIVLGAVLLPGVTPMAHADECTQESLDGSYGFLLSGQLLPPTGPRLLVGAVGLIDFHGDGSLTAQGRVTTNGVASPPVVNPPGIGTGSYTVNSNCTGFATIGGDFAGLSFDFMIVPGTEGSEVSFIVTTPGTVQTGVAMRTGDEECTLASLQGTYRILGGGVAGGGPNFAAVGFRILDGAGALTAAEDTTSLNGVIAHRIGRTAIYTVNSNCTAHATFADGPTFEGVIVAGGSEAYFLRTNLASGGVGAALLKKQVRHGPRSRHHDDN